MDLRADDIRPFLANTPRSGLEAGFVIRLGRETKTEAITELAVPPVEESVETREPENDRPKFDVELVPGSYRIVTSVINSEVPLLEFRIPSYWRDIETAIDDPSTGIFL